MKIGFSFGRCVRDLVTEKVAFEDVLVIVCRTYMSEREHIGAVINQYLYEPRYLLGLDRQACLDMGDRLWDAGKLHQPRVLYNVNPPRVPEDLIWMDVVPTALSDNPVVQGAWDAYRMMLKLDGRSIPRPPPAGEV